MYEVLFSLKIIVAVFIAVFFVFGVAFFYQDNKIEHLKRVEWLYRWSRIGKADTEEYQDFERRMLDGKKEEREGMKAKIFNMERNAPQSSTSDLSMTGLQNHRSRPKQRSRSNQSRRLNQSRNRCHMSNAPAWLRPK